MGSVTRVSSALARVCWRQWVSNRRPASMRWRKTALSFGRFLDQSCVSRDEVLTTAGRFTGQRASGRHVLAIQDTTEFNCPRHAASKSGFGRSGNDRDLGLFLHPTIAVDAVHGGMIGLVGAQVLNRTNAKADNPKQRMIEERESYRWLLAADEASAT